MNILTTKRIDHDCPFPQSGHLAHRFLDLGPGRFQRLDLRRHVGEREADAVNHASLTGQGSGRLDGHELDRRRPAGLRTVSRIAPPRVSRLSAPPVSRSTQSAAAREGPPRGGWSGGRVGGAWGGREIPKSATRSMPHRRDEVFIVRDLRSFVTSFFVWLILKNRKRSRTA